MIKKVFYIVTLITFYACGVTKEIKEEDKTIITGVIQKKILESPPYNEWFVPKYNKTTFDSEIILGIKKHIKEVDIKIFLGVWCGDSKREVPVFYKLLEQVGFDKNKLEVVALDKKKKAKGLEKGYDIIKVPTFIFYKGNKELGRFVEFPVESLAKDILKIISGNLYKHSYQE